MELNLSISGPEACKDVVKRRFKLRKKPSLKTSSVLKQSSGHENRKNHEKKKYSSRANLRKYILGFISHAVWDVAYLQAQLKRMHVISYWSKTEKKVITNVIQQ